MLLGEYIDTWLWFSAFYLGDKTVSSTSKISLRIFMLEYLLLIA